MARREEPSIYRTPSESAAYARELREARGWTVAEAEERAAEHLLPGEIEKAERDGTRDVYTMAALADLYGVETITFLHRPNLSVEQQIFLLEEKLDLYEGTLRPMYETPWEGEGFDPWDVDDPEERLVSLARVDQEIDEIRRELLKMQLQVAGRLAVLPEAHELELPLEAQPAAVAAAETVS